MRFERTQDYEKAREIITHPNLYPHLSDDLAPAREDFQPAQHPAIWYVLVYDGEELLGMWMFAPSNSVCWEVHTCLLPNAWGSKGRTAAREMANWIFENTPCRRIITTVPVENVLALRFAESAGMKKYGCNEKSWLKDGELQDQILLGLSKPDIEPPKGAF